VPGRGFSDRVIVVRVREPCATRQSRQATVELGPEAIQIIASELVYGDQHYERWGGVGAGSRWGVGLSPGAGGAQAQDAKEQKYGSYGSQHSPKLMARSHHSPKPMA
jgi:hypothetical protein